MTIQEYLEIKEIRQNTTAMLYHGKWYRLVDGFWITEKEFNEMYPLPIRIGKPKPNPDGTKNYLL